MKATRLALGLYCLSSLFLIAPIAFCDDWTTQDTVMQSLGSTLWAVDCLQTIEISRSKEYWETNKILGEHPSEEAVYAYFTGAIIGSFIIAKALPKKYRKYWQGFFIGVGYSSSIHNHNIGVRITF